MNIDDFINSLSDIVDYNNFELQHRTNCIAMMYAECYDITCKYFPDKVQILSNYREDPGEEMNWSLKVIYELTSNLVKHYENYPDEPYLHRDLKPIMRSTGATQDEINEILAHVPPELHEESLKILHQCDAKDHELDDYAFDIHRGLKKVVVDFFPQTYDLPSRGLRELDSELFWLKDEIIDLIFTWFN